MRLKHVHAFKDRHGRRRFYVRIPGAKAIPLHGEPGSPEFLAAYQAAIAGPAMPRQNAPGAAPGSLDALAASYYRSAPWKALSEASQATYRRLVEKLRAEFGSMPAAMLEPRHIRAMVAERAGEKPAASNNLLRTIRALMRHAIDAGMREDDPTRDVRRVQYRKKGFRTWQEDHIAAYEARWPSGSKQRLALALLLYTGQRRGDVVKLGRQHLSPAGITLRQGKTDAPLVIPVHPHLAAELAHVPAGQLTFLLTEYGKPYTAAGFTGTFSEWREAAGIAGGLSPHGLRKAACRRLAEAGCSASLIQSISGHRTLAEVERYTREVDQQRMAVDAMARIRPGT